MSIRNNYSSKQRFFRTIKTYNLKKVRWSLKNNYVNTELVMIFSYLNLPIIPDHFLEYDINIIESNKNIFRNPKYLYYKQYNVNNKELLTFLKNIFPFNFFVAYQIVRNGIHIHKDGSRTECLNYQYCVGGKSNRLNLYDNQLNILDQINIKPKKWHYIDVGKFHNVNNLTEPRIGISITRTDGNSLLEWIKDNNLHSNL